MRTALISSFDKREHIAIFASKLVDMDWKILASKGTWEFLFEKLVPAEDVGVIVGEPLLGHRVVTLDRRLHAALQARPDNRRDKAELKALGMYPIDLVYVDCYPLTLDGAVEDSTTLEGIDIGGPALLRAAAKGGRYVLCRPEQLEPAVRFLGSPPGKKDVRAFKLELAAQAEAHCAHYSAKAAILYQQTRDLMGKRKPTTSKVA